MKITPFGFLLAVTTALPAQIEATYTPYARGCAGTGSGIGASHVAPMVFATAWGSSNNALGFSGAPSRYQQVFLASEFPTAYTMAALGLRWDNQTLFSYHGATFDLEIRVGYTTRTPTTLSTTFAANFDSGTPVTVLARSYVKYPDNKNPPPTDPTVFQVMIPWTTTFSWVPQPGRNLLVEVVQRGNDSGMPWNYIFDAGYCSSTARLYASPDTATTGSLDGFAYGYMMNFYAWTDTAVPTLANKDMPQIGNTFEVRLGQAKPTTPATLLHGGSKTTWAGYGLPLDLGFLGAPLCPLLAAPDVLLPLTTDASGMSTYVYTVPMNFSFIGVAFHNQFLVLDPGANALGLAVSNGGTGVIGT